MTIEHPRDKIGGPGGIYHNAPGPWSNLSERSNVSTIPEALPKSPTPADVRAAEGALLARLVAELRQPPVAPWRRPMHHLIDAIHDAEAEWELDRHGRRVA